MIWTRLRDHGWILAWFAIIATAIATRAPIPIDETRYLAAAWEMWNRGDFLVPYLNGQPYSHKPPLLFWLFHSGWWVFGVNAIWPRVALALCALLVLFWASRITQRLWPEDRQASVYAPWILNGCLFWVLFSPSIMFDVLLTAVVLLGVIGMLRVDLGKRYSGWMLFAVAAGLGILAKGPVVLLHLASLSLLGPLWSKTAKHKPIHWYAGVLTGLLIGAAIALAWALTAGHSGGPEYEQAILWHQTTDRMVESFAHRRPIWWYLPLLPVMLFPWLVWPAFWRGVRRVNWTHDTGVRLCLVWSVPVFLAFSLISGKQPHYLLPLFIPFALVSARALSNPGVNPFGRFSKLPEVLVLLTGLLMLGISVWPPGNAAEWVGRFSPVWGLALVSGAVLLLWMKIGSIYSAIIRHSVASVLMVSLLAAGFLSAAGKSYDLTVVSQKIARLQKENTPVANIGKYHGQFHFAGRLEKRISPIGEDELSEWLGDHPQGWVIYYHRKPLPPQSAPEPYEQFYRGKRLSLWSGARLCEYLQCQAGIDNQK